MMSTMKGANKSVLGLFKDVENDDFFGYLERVIVTLAVCPHLDESHNSDIQGTKQKSHCVNSVSGHRKGFAFIGTVGFSFSAPVLRCLFIHSTTHRQADSHSDRQTDNR